MRFPAALFGVALPTSAWIETLTQLFDHYQALVALPTSAWIETIRYM